MNRLTLGAIGAAGVAAVILARLEAAPTDAGLSWLAGSWCGSSDGVANEELWLAERGGLMLGMHRDTKESKAISFEFLRIERRDGGYVYVAQPGGQPPTEFAQSASGSRSVTFANPAHDFPKRIRYRSAAPASLEVRIDDGTDSGMSMSWKWSQCGPIGP
jgi:hypothetical protein